MPKHSEYFVEKREADGNWVVKLPHAERVSAIRTNQREAIGRARELAPEGVIHVKQANGNSEKPDMSGAMKAGISRFLKLGWHVVTEAHTALWVIGE